VNWVERGKNSGVRGKLDTGLVLMFKWEIFLWNTSQSITCAQLDELNMNLNDLRSDPFLPADDDMTSPPKEERSYQTSVFGIDIRPVTAAVTNLDLSPFKRLDDTMILFEVDRSSFPLYWAESCSECPLIRF